MPGAAIGGLYARYEDEKVRRGLVDFDDLLARCADAMETDPGFASAQRWRWRHLFVDEFQDLNPLQHRLLTAWLGSSTDLCVVGDPHQAVYGWNGGDADFLAQVPVRWPSTEVLYLDDNHRCTPQIVAVAAAVLGADGSRLRSAAGDGPPAEVRAYPTDTAEAHGIAAGLRAAGSRGRRWASLAVLTRTNAQLITIQEALRAARVPFWSPAQGALLHDPLVAGILDEIRPHPRAPMQAVTADLAEQARETQSSDELRTLVTVLADLAGVFQRQVPDGVAAQWLAWLPSALSDDPRGPRPTEAVTLCSFHRAKGLEWDEVWVAGLERGRVPIGRATSPAAEAEERRLLYVALTRAGVALHCSWARQRTFSTGSAPRQASPWLELIGAAPGDPVPDDAGGSAGGSSLAPEAARSAAAARRSTARPIRPAGCRCRRDGRSQTPSWWTRPASVASGGGSGRRDTRLCRAARRHHGGAGVAAAPDDRGASGGSRPRSRQSQPLRSDPAVAALRPGCRRLSDPYRRFLRPKRCRAGTTRATL